MTIRGKPNPALPLTVKNTVAGVPLEVLWDYEQARQIGDCNMFDHSCLRSMCYSYSLHHLLNYMEVEGKHFMDGIITAYDRKAEWWVDDEEGSGGGAE